MKIGPKKHWKKGRKSPRRAMYWLMGGVIASTAAGGHFRPAFALSPAGRWEQSTPQATPAIHFDIAAGLLDDVLSSFQKVSGLQVSLSRQGIGNLPSMGVKGDYTAEKALQQILSGTGVTYRYTASQTVTLDLQGVAEALDVTTVAPVIAASSAKYTEPLRDVPQTIEVIPKAVMEQQGATTLSDALRNVPGITLQAGEGGGASSTAGDMFNLRGFNASNSLFVDGVRDDGLISRNVYNLEQVEVFLGPTGSDVGRGTASGYVNMQTKSPRLRPAYYTTVSYDNADQKRVSMDLNHDLRLGSADAWINRSALRLNGFWQDGGIAGREIVRVRNRSLAPSLAFGLDSSTRLLLSSQLTRQNNTPDYGIPSAAWTGAPFISTGVKALNPVETSNYYGSLDYDYDRVSQQSYTSRVEHDFRNGFSLRNQTRYNETHRTAIITGIGNFAAATQTVSLSRQGNERQNEVVSNQASTIGRFETGSVKHSTSAGVEYSFEKQFAPTLAGAGTRAAVSIYEPNPRDPVTGYAPVRTGAASTGRTHTIAFYGFDTVELSRNWQINGGVRIEHYKTRYRVNDTAGVNTTDQESAKGLFSGKAGVVYRISERGNAYFSYGTSLTPPGTANFTLSAQANNQNNPNVKPQESRNYEAGSKWDFYGGRLALTGAAFRTQNKNVIYTVDSTAVPPIFNQDDGQRVRGLTLGTIGRLTEGLQVMVNLAYLDSRLETQNAATNGKRLTLSPAFSGSVWVTYRLPAGVNIGGGLRHSDAAFVNTANTIRVPASQVVDALTEYEVNKHLSLRVNIYNVTDKKYVRSVNNNGVRFNPGGPRSAMVTSSFRF